MALQDPALGPPHLFFFLPDFYFWEQGWATCGEASRGALPTCTTPVISPHPFSVASDPVASGISTHLFKIRDALHQTRASFFGPWNWARE